ncbi:HEPN/Toprim-associated domain-containing protein [Pseudomonas syringae]
MSSWYDIKIQGQTVYSNSSQCFSQWFFHKSDQVIRDADKSANEHREYLYVSDVATVRRRLALEGCDRNALELEYEKALLDIEQEFEYAAEYFPEDVTKLRSAIQDMTLDDWISKLKMISDKKLDTYAQGRQEPNPDPVLDYLLSTNKWYSDNRYTQFPCISPDCYILSFLEFAPDDAEVVMDCTDCVEARSINAFDTHIEHLQKRTNFYEILKVSTDEIENILHTTQDNPTLTKLLYSGTITALETYLSDTLRKLVLNNRTLMRRYVECEEHFNKNIKVNQIFQKFEQLEKEASTTLDRTSFHNIEEASKLYASVLLVTFPRDEVLDLKKAVSIRHDIVHRNGKTFKGEQRNITSKNVTDLISLMISFVEKIDAQIKNNLLNYENNSEIERIDVGKRPQYFIL